MTIAIVPRSGWGAQPPRAVTPNPAKTLRGVTVHWFGSPKAASSHDGCPALLRAVQRHHQAGEYVDIAYNHAVCPHGSVYELRGFGVRSGANGTSFANSSYSAVVYMAGTGDAFTAAGKKALRWIIGEWRKQGAGKDVKPHGHWTGSACPGPDVGLWVAVRGYEPVLPPVTVERMATLRAWILARHAEGWTWARIKRSSNFREYRRGGGR